MIHFHEDSARDEAVRRVGETLWRFWSRSAWDRSEKVRRELTSLLGHIPAKHQPEYISRLKADEDRLVLSTYTEMAACFLLMQIAPPILLNMKTTGKSRSDAFLAGFGIHVEVHRMSKPDSMAANDKRRQQVLESLNKIPSTYFFLGTEISMGSKAPSISSRRGEIKRWLDNLDYTSELEEFSTDPSLYQGPTFDLSVGDSKITLEAIPRGRVRDDSVTVGLISGEDLFLPGYDGMQKAIDGKVRQHHGLSAPLVVVLDLTETHPFDDEIAAALYGPTVEEFRSRRIYRRRTDCIWPKQPPASQPAAVITINNFYIGRFQESSWSLWLPPGTTESPLPSGPWETHSLDMTDEMSIRVSSAVKSLPVLEI